MTAINKMYFDIMDRYQNMIGDGPKNVGTGALDSPQPAGQSFTELLSSELGKVNATQIKADEVVADFAAGGETDLHQVMIAAEEARLSMEMAVQIRNKMIEAYKELNSMQM